MQDRFLDLYRAAHAAHMRVVQLVVELEREMTKCASQEEHADLAYVCRDADKLLHDAGVEVRKLSGLCARMMTVLWAADPTSSDRVRTTWCSAAPDTKIETDVPTLKESPSEYRALLAHFGVPSEVIESGVLKVSYSQLAEYVTTCTRDCRPVPPSLGEQRTTHRLNIVAKRKLSSALGDVSLMDDNNEREE